LLSSVFCFSVKLYQDKTPAILHADDHNLFKRSQVFHGRVVTYVSDAFKPVFKIGDELVVELEDVQIFFLVFMADKISAMLQCSPVARQCTGRVIFIDKPCYTVIVLLE
jgi:hypothetical protein